MGKEERVMVRECHLYLAYREGVVSVLMCRAIAR